MTQFDAGDRCHHHLGHMQKANTDIAYHVVNSDSSVSEEGMALL